MPRVWAASWPAFLMWTEVMAMTPLITRLPTAIAHTPSRAERCELTNRQAAAIPVRGAVEVGTFGIAVASRATTAGSGLRNESRSRPAKPRSTAERTKGPARVGTPYRPTDVPATGARLGPATAPRVVAQTISERWRPRSAGGARSIAE